MLREKFSRKLDWINFEVFSDAACKQKLKISNSPNMMPERKTSFIINANISSHFIHFFFATASSKKTNLVNGNSREGFLMPFNVIWLRWESRFSKALNLIKQLEKFHCDCKHVIKMWLQRLTVIIQQRFDLRNQSWGNKLIRFHCQLSVSYANNILLSIHAILSFNRLALRSSRTNSVDVAFVYSIRATELPQLRVALGF